MPLADETLRMTRDLYFEAFVAGVRLVPQPSVVVGALDFNASFAVRSLRLTKSIDQPVPICSLDVTGIPAWVKRGQRVQIILGYNRIGAKVFDGYIQDRQRRAGPLGGTLNCVGRNYHLYNLVEIPARDVNGQTVQAAIEGILDYAGILDRAVSAPAFTLGTASDAILERATAAQMLQQLFDIDGLFMFETGAGQVIIRQLDIRPAGSAFRTYSTYDVATARIIEGSDQEDPSFLRTRVFFTGATVVEGTPPAETTRTIAATAALINSPLVQPPLPANTYLDAEFTNDLVDTDAKAIADAARLLSKYARVPREITIELPGDPELEIGQTIELAFPELGANLRGILIALDQTVDAEAGFRSRLTLRGGDEYGGAVNIAPVADFTYSIQRIIIDTKVWAVVTFDGSASHDPDGSIASYDWGDNQATPTTPDLDAQTAAVVTVRVDPALLSGDWEVTLTVVDNSNALSGAMTRTIPVTPTSTIVNVPSVFAALENTFASTWNGGENWNDQAGPGGGVTIQSVAARHQDGIDWGIACYGCSNGDIYRTLDYCQSAPTKVRTGTGVATVDIAWDWREFNRVWALQADWKILVSTDGGATFSQVADLISRYGMSGSALAERLRIFWPGSVWVFGGDGAGRPVIAVETGIGSFLRIPLGGHLTTDLPAANAACRIIDAATKSDLGGFVIALTAADGGTSGVRPLYSCINPFQPDDATTGWKRATGLTAGVQNARYVVPTELSGKFIAAFADRDVWTSVALPAWTAASNVMPVNVTPRSALFSRDYEAGVALGAFHLISAEHSSLTAGLYLSADEIQSVGVFRPATGFATWPASAIGRRCALGPELGRSGRVLLLGIPSGGGAARLAAYRTNEVVFTKGTTTAFAGTLLRPRATKPLVWFLFGYGSATDYSNATCARTVNGGVSFSALAAPAANRKWQDIAVGADGRLWGVTIDTAALGHSEVWYSDYDGANWTESKDYNVTNQRLFRVICHPTNAQRIWVFGTGNVLQVDAVTAYTPDRGVTWASNTDSSIFNSDPGHELDTIALDIVQDSGRLVMNTPLKSGASTVNRILTTSTNGSIWTERKAFTAGNKTLGPVGSKRGEKLFVVEDDVGAGTTRIWQSLDQGVTWVRVNVAIPRQAAGIKPKGGIAYDEREDALYIASEAGITTNTKLVERLGPMDTDALGQLNPFSVPQDFSDTLVPIGGSTSYAISAWGQHIMLIP